MTALSAPDDAPAAARTGTPRSISAAATPASHAPLAPPPENTSAAGASAGTSLALQAADTVVAAPPTASRSSHRARLITAGPLCNIPHRGGPGGAAWVAHREGGGGPFPEAVGRRTPHRAGLPQGQRPARGAPESAPP